MTAKTTTQNEWRVVTVRVLLFTALGFLIPLTAYIVFGKVPHGLPKEKVTETQQVASPKP